MFSPKPPQHQPMIRLVVLLTFVFSATVAQVKPLSSSELFLNLKKLNVCASVLHVAAHPDDENTLLLTYLAKERLVRTGYLSLTRGDGGQNLIGAEQGEYVGIIRTQELLAARKIDGPDQFFSRAYDFGFSKSTDEAVRLWGKEKVLGDVVWMIRKYRPDVVITRFPPDARAGHGHHSASAFLAEEAFKISDDPTQYPEQLAFVKPWKAKRIVWNSYSPGFQNNKPSVEKLAFIPIEIGLYNPFLGKSYGEIAAESRSQHKSQGFGVPANRTVRIDYLLHKNGDPAEKDLLDGIDATWNRVKNSEKVAELIGQAIANYNLAKPSASVPVLVQIYQELSKLDATDIYVSTKKQEVETLIMNCLGLWFETNPAQFSAVAGEPTELKINVVSRSEQVVKLVKMAFTGATRDTTLNLTLKTNEQFNFPITVSIPQNQKISQPYWLEKPIDKGIFQIDDQNLIGQPENVPALYTDFTFLIENQTFTFRKPWIYKSVDPVDGESYRPFEVRPEVTANLTEKVYVFADNTPKMVEVLLKANQANCVGELRLETPTGWKIDPEVAVFDLKEKYAEQRFSFRLTPSTGFSEGKIKAVVKTQRGESSRSLRSVVYKHIPTQTLFPLAEAKLAKLEIKVKAKKVGYIAGAGDEVPAGLRQMGCAVTMLDEAELSKDLASYDAIVVGIRAYNTEERLKYYQEKLMEYVKNGGTMVVQYVTGGGSFLNNGLKVKQMGPYPFAISRERVTEEDAKMNVLQANHPILNYPNKITDADFNGWVQERGIYFAQDWDKNYVPIFSCNDTNEAPKEGSLIYAAYGKGHFMYTGLAFFRQLPNGVPGAYRLFANMISVGKK